MKAGYSCGYQLEFVQKVSWGALVYNGRAVKFFEPAELQTTSLIKDDYSGDRMARRTPGLTRQRLLRQFSRLRTSLSEPKHGCAVGTKHLASKKLAVSPNVSPADLFDQTDMRRSRKRADLEAGTQAVLVRFDLTDEILRAEFD